MANDKLDVIVIFTTRRWKQTTFLSPWHRMFLYAGNFVSFVVVVARGNFLCKILSNVCFIIRYLAIHSVCLCLCTIKYVWHKQTSSKTFAFINIHNYKPSFKCWYSLSKTTLKHIHRKKHGLTVQWLRKSLYNIYISLFDKCLPHSWHSISISLHNS